MKYLFLGVLLATSAYANATDWEQYVTIRKDAVVCRTATALFEVKRRFGNALEQADNQEVKTYLSQSGCIRAPVDQRVHAAILELGRAQIDVAVSKGYVPIVWVTADNQNQYGAAFTADLQN